MIPILSGNVTSALPSGYDVANSCRFNSADSAKMAITFSGAGTSLRKATFSFWIKRSNLTVDEELLYRISSGSDYFNIAFSDTDTLKIKQSISSSVNLEFISNAVYRDPSAWMHLLVVFDTTQSTESNRVKIYVNGTQVTSWSTSTYPTQNTDMLFGATNANTIASSGGGNYFGGYLCEVCYCDGQSLTPSDFGEFDSSSPTIWKPKDPSGLTFGTNGFYLDFEDSSNLGNDANGGTDLTETNIDATDQATDTCTNNFCTWNPLANYTNGVAFSEGNLVAMSGTNDQWDGGRASIGFSQGKWYFECLFVAGVSTQYIGVQDESAGFTGSSPHDQNGTTVFYNNSGGEIRKDGSATTNDYGTFTSSQVAGIAIDADNFTISVYKGGSAIVNAYALSTTRTGFLFPFTANLNNGDGVKVNFGSPPYSESGGNTDANGYGNFNQSVPSGYFAINSKNLAEYG